MKCSRAKELISARLDEEITLVDDAALQLHLNECSRCRKRLEALRRREQTFAHLYDSQREAAAALVDRILTHLSTKDPAIQPRCTVLVVDDRIDHEMAWVEPALATEFEVLLAHSSAEAQEQFRHKRIDLILTDQRMPAMSGVLLLEWVVQNHPRTVRLLMTGFDELDSAIDAINRGQVFRYLPKPIKLEGLLATVRDAARMAQLERDHEHMLKELRALNDELELRVTERTRQLEEANAELEEKTQMLEKFALNDALTGLPNRRALDYLMERELRWRDRYPAPLTVAMLDVDHFKEINTRHLHPGGDKVLKELAEGLTKGLRKIDVLGRMGGEEFLLILPQTSEAGARVVAERIRAQVEAQVFTFRKQVIPVRISIGLAVLELGATADYEQVKLAAAAALKRAKDLGRNRVEVEVLPPPAQEPFTAEVSSA
ncbi:MAG: diguanylate cyclase [Gemmataceae bacterium]|nr:diguanylate cyclase [Gemmataceae bacterium]